LFILCEDFPVRILLIYILGNSFDRKENISFHSLKC
jgi:hypothetical protein